MLVTCSSCKLIDYSFNMPYIDKQYYCYDCTLCKECDRTRKMCMLYGNGELTYIEEKQFFLCQRCKFFTGN